MKFLIASGSRSGSEFSIRLLEALVGGEIHPVAKVHSARDSDGTYSPSYRELKDEGRHTDFAPTHSVTTLKLEDPGVDADAYDFLSAYPDALVVATFRPIEKVVNSHGNIKPWGMPPAQVVKNWMGNLEFYEHAEKAGRLLMIPIGDPEAFNAEAAAQKAGTVVSQQLTDFLSQWPRVNDLKSQKEYSNDTSDVSFHMTRAELLEKFPEIKEGTQRYEDLTRRCNGNLFKEAEIEGVNQ